MKLAAIDIGSNAVRLLLASVYEEEFATENLSEKPVFKKEALIRMPLRLGDEAFIDHVISERKTEQLINTLIGFKHLLLAYEPLDFYACATAAMRETENGKEIIDTIYQRTGIAVDIISGSKEAEILFYNHFENSLRWHTPYLYIDVGGGSVEVTFFSSNKPPLGSSFKIGAIRLLNDLVPESEWSKLKNWLDHNVDPHAKSIAIGSGGNINKVFKLMGKKTDELLSYKEIQHVYDRLRHITFEERIKYYRMKTDRADVIVPALQIYLNVMKWGYCKKMFVPQTGLADGIIHILYNKHAHLLTV